MTCSFSVFGFRLYLGATQLLSAHFHTVPTCPIIHIMKTPTATLIATSIWASCVSLGAAFAPLSYDSPINTHRGLTELSAKPFQGTAVACTGRTCTQKGGKKMIALLQELAPEGVTVETINCVSECAECNMGPNVELRATGDDGPFYPIKNNVRTEEDIRSILGLPAAVAEATSEDK